MSRNVVVTVLAFIVVLVPGSDLSACGDKFLLLGRAVGYEKILKASNPGSVVIYSSPNLPAVFNDGRFGALMDVAGHRQQSVSDRQALERALASGKIDLVLADPAVSRTIADSVRASSKALVVPITTNASAAQRADLIR